MKSELDPGQGSSFVARLLVRLVGLFCRFPYPTLVLTLGLAGVSIYIFCADLKYYTSRNDLISPNKDYQQRWKQYLKEFGKDDDVVVVVEGNDTNRMKQALESIAAEVRRRPTLFDRLFYKVDLRALQDRSLLYLPAYHIDQIQNNLKSMSLLLEFGPVAWRELTLFQLLHEARNRAGKIAPGKPLTLADRQLFDQLLSLAGSAKDTLDNPAAYKNPWHSLLPAAPEQTDLMAAPQYFFSGDGKLAFLLTRPIETARSFTADQDSVNGMNEIVAAMRTSYPDLTFGMTGLPVLETDEMSASQQDTEKASLLALFGVLGIYTIALRGFRYPVAITVALMVGTAWAGGWMTMTVGHLNILSATFGMMLLAMGDYGVLWVTRYEQERAAGRSVLEANCNTAASVGPGSLTAAGSTALAFSADMLDDFQAVAELGWIVGSGIFLCALSCLFIMTAILDITDRRLHCVKLPTTYETPLAPWLPLLARKPMWVIAGSIAVAVILGYSAFKVHYDHNLLHLQARGLESVKWELNLVERTAGARWHALSYTANQQEALALKSRFEKLPEVARVVEMASLIPLEQEQKQKQLEDVQRRLQHLPERGSTVAHDIPKPIPLKTELAVLVGQLQPLADVSPEPLLQNLRQSLVALRDKIDDVSSSLAEVRLQEFEQRMTADLIGDLYRLRDCSKPGTITLDDMPGDFREAATSWLERQMAVARFRQRLALGVWTAGPLLQGDSVGRPGSDRQTLHDSRRLEGNAARLPVGRGLRATGYRLGARRRFSPVASRTPCFGAAVHGYARNPGHYGLVQPAVEPRQHDRFSAHHRRRRRQRGARIARLPVAQKHRQTLSAQSHDRPRHLRARSYDHLGIWPANDLAPPGPIRPRSRPDPGSQLLHGLGPDLPPCSAPRLEQAPRP